MENVAEKLSREIARVSKLEQIYEDLEQRPNVLVVPVLLLIEDCLENAHKAAGMDDAVIQLSAISKLQDFTE